MKCDPRDFAVGAVLLAMVPALLLYQSFNTSAGTAPEHSEYNVDQLGSAITEYLYFGDPKALDFFCDYALDRDGSVPYATAWIESIAKRCGEGYHVHLARGRLHAFKGDLSNMRREFSAALELAVNQIQRDRISQLLRKGNAK